MAEESAIFPHIRVVDASLASVRDYFANSQCSGIQSRHYNRSLHEVCRQRFAKMVPFRFGILLAILGIALAQQPLYGQCGGIGWSGGTTCVSGATCTKLNDYYSQCLPGSASSSTTAQSSTSTRSTTSTTSAPSTSSSSSSAPSSTPSNMSPEWAAAYTKARTAVVKLSLQDKVNLATGVGWQNGHCVGNTPAVSSISFPGLCLEDSPLGVRYADSASAFPAAINVGATFNRTLMRQRGAALGAEFKGKGVHVALGPMMNLARVPAAGRNWEGFGSDPYLSGEGAYETIMGTQSMGVQATAKHYINNEQEHFRATSSSNVDDSVFFLQQHELYAAPFLRSVQANVASVMCSYNQINGSFACENDKMLNGILKGEFGFPGYVMSDWQATHSTLSVNKGLDMTMPGDITFNSGTTYFGSALVSAVQSGTVPQSRIDDMALRILAAWYLLGQDSGFPAVNFDAWNINAPVNTHANVQSDHKNVIRQIGAASTILLKNTGGVLPVKTPKTIAIIGNGAGPSSRGPNGYTDRGGDDGVLAMGWGSGTADFPYLITPLDAITARAKADGTTVTSSLSDTDLNAAGNAASGKDIAFVFITADSGEGYITVEGHAGDRNNLQAWHSGDALVAKVASVNAKTIVVVNSVGPIIMEPWINNANEFIQLLLWFGADCPVKKQTYYMESTIPGKRILLIDAELSTRTYTCFVTSGRLPYTIGKSIDDYGANVIYSSSSSIVPIPYNEGLFIDYRHFDQANITPRFEFGFGLSYTTFDYSGLTITGSVSGGSAPSGPGSSLDPWLHTKVITATFTLKNNGTVAGHEIPQLYISPPASANSAPRNLKGFDSIYLTPGQSTTVSLQLSRYDLSIWNVVTQRWQIPSGATGILVGASSRDIRLTGSVTN
ncbi:glycoside hydrolase family 3 protein [Crucibulum laeve]|uniref:beta-glucosidase n=1 Tax=Crucibulum laeve TaxID=68775 RepID=A0A5C3M6B2_9AGAR|nr:glycoside hydrolase family 3 protein [Crucibulum laeve]